MAKYLEELPCGCPPSDAEDIVSTRIMYRMIEGDTPIAQDFYSHKKRNSNLKYHDPLKMCQAHGLSLFDDPEKAIKATRARYPNHRVCRLILQEGSGKILKTDSAGHYTWWPFEEFDILRACEVQAND